MESDRIIALKYAFAANFEETKDELSGLDEYIHKCYEHNVIQDKRLLKEFLEYEPPFRPYGQDWDYELEQLRLELHRKIDGMFMIEMFRSIYKEYEQYNFGLRVKLDNRVFFDPYGLDVT